MTLQGSFLYLTFEAHPQLRYHATARLFLKVKIFQSIILTITTLCPHQAHQAVLIRSLGPHRSKNTDFLIYHYYRTIHTKPLAPPTSSGRPPHHTKPSLISEKKIIIKYLFNYLHNPESPVKSHGDNHQCPMTVAVLQMQGSRTSSTSRLQHPGKAPRNQLPAIAPRYQLASDLDAFIKTESTVKASVSLLRTRLPPRSRFGCWCVFLLRICSC